MSLLIKALEQAAKDRTAGRTDAPPDAPQAAEPVGETDETVNKRVKAVLAAGLHPIICVGETLADARHRGDHSRAVRVRGPFRPARPSSARPPCRSSASRLRGGRA